MAQRHPSSEPTTEPTAEPHPADAPPGSARRARHSGLPTWGDEAGLVRLARLAARSLAAPAAAVYFGDGRPLIGSQHPEPYARNDPLFEAIRQCGGLITAHRDSQCRFADASVVGVPLDALPGGLTGALCVAAFAPRQWTRDDVVALEDLALSWSAEHAHRAAIAELEELLDTTTELVCAADETGRIGYVNRAWQRTFGYTLEEASAMRPVDLVAPEHRARFLDAARRLTRGEPIAEFEAVLLARDGRRVVCRGRATAQLAPGPDGPRVVGTRAVYRDVTAERHAEAMRARLATTLEATSDFVGISTIDGSLVYINRAGRHLVGLPEDADLSLLRTDDLHPPATLERFQREVLPVVRAGGVWEGEVELLAAGGEAIPVSLVMLAHPSTRADESPYFLSTVMRDLRERVRAERARRESEQRFRAAMEGGQDAFFILRSVRDDAGAIVDFEVVELNSRAAVLLRRPHDALLGGRLRALFPTAETHGHFARYVRVAETGEMEEYEFQSADPHVGARWLRSQVVALGDGIAVTTRDITLRRQTERKLALVHHVTAILGTAASAEDALRSALAAMCEATGWSYGEAWLPTDAPADGTRARPGRRRLAHGPVWHEPGDERLAAFARASDAHSFGPGEGSPGRSWVSRAVEWTPDVQAAGARFSRAGQARDAGLRTGVAVPVLAEGEVVAVLAFHTRALETVDAARVDLLATVGAQVGSLVRRQWAEAALRESEQHFRGVLENLRTVALLLDARGRVTFANDALLELTGWTRAELIGADWRARALPEGDEVGARFAESLAAGSIPAHTENAIATKAGARRLVAWDNVLLRDPDGRVRGLASVGRDVTDEARVRELKDQLIATVSHELRGPLGAIRGGLQVLGRKTTIPEGPSRTFYEMAVRNTDRLLRLVNDLLDIERVESGTAPMAPAVVPVAPLLAGALETSQAAADAADVTLEVAPGAERELLVWADADRVVQVLTNLVGNAVKFSPAGSTVTLSVCEADDGAVAFAVRDRGRGIPADKLETIFARFEQVHAADAKEKGGAGLGLAISRAIVEQHGGRIWAERAPDVGSVFTFTLRKAEQPGGGE